MQGSLSASYDQITWVLTFLRGGVGDHDGAGGVAGVAVRPQEPAPDGAVRLPGRLHAVRRFAVAGPDRHLPAATRHVRRRPGAAGAATMLDIYPFEQRAQAMAIFGTGTMLGPIMGPTLGGILTDAYSWRWVFYVNVPVGIVAITGLFILLPKTRKTLTCGSTGPASFVLALGIGAFQMMLDAARTRTGSTPARSIIEAVLAGLGSICSCAHVYAERPFIPREVFKTEFHGCAAFMMFFVGMVLLASSALLHPTCKTRRLPRSTPPASPWAAAASGTMMAIAARRPRHRRAHRPAQAGRRTALPAVTRHVTT